MAEEIVSSPEPILMDDLLKRKLELKELEEQNKIQAIREINAICDKYGFKLVITQTIELVAR